MGVEVRPKIVPLPDVPFGIRISDNREPKRAPAKFRHRFLALSYVILVIIPALFITAYYALIASDRFIAKAGFSIRGLDQPSSDIFGTITGISNTNQTTSDSYILLKFLESRDVLERLENDFPFLQHYSQDGIDWLSRLNPDQSIEKRINYWRRQINTSYNNASGIITFEVEAFEPESTLKIATLLLSYSYELVNKLSARARHDALVHSEEEVARAEKRLTTALQSIRNFRGTEKSLDPGAAARIQLELIGSLEKQLAEIRTRITTLQNSVGDDSPSLRNLIRQSKALEQQINEQRAATSDTNNNVQATTLTDQLAVYETLEIERDFAQQYYALSLASLEKTRIEAARQQRYLAVYSEPARPEQPVYPKRIANILLFFAALNIIWAIGALFTYSIRDHIS